MPKIASDDGYVVLRDATRVRVVTVRGLRTYITNFMNEQFRKYDLPPIPIVLWEEPPIHLTSSYAWISLAREEGKAVAISFSLPHMGGMNMEQLRETMLHELCHYLIFQQQPELKEENDGHGPVFYETCRMVGCEPARGGTHDIIHSRFRRSLTRDISDANEEILFGDLGKVKPT